AQSYLQRPAAHRLVRRAVRPVRDVGRAVRGRHPDRRLRRRDHGALPFVVMLLNAPYEETEADERRHILLRSGPLRFGAFLAVVLASELAWALTRRGESGPFAGGSTTSVAAIGRSLFTDYAFAFEVTSVLILVAMVGAVVLASREKT